MAKGDWTYIESEELKQTIAFDKKSGWLICKDGTKYSPKELALVTQNWTSPLPGVPLQVHILKKEFGGTIVSVGKN